MQGTATVSEVPQKSAASALPFSQELVDFLIKGVVLSGAMSIGATKMNNDYATILGTIFMTFVTFFGYVWGARLPAAFCKIVHPLVTSTAIVHVFTYLTSLAVGSSFTNVLSNYKTGTMKLLATGAGDILLYLLGPCVVSFAISMYSRKTVVAENLLVIFTGFAVASIGGLFGTAALVRLLKVGGAAGDVLRKSLLPRNITTPLAIAITNIIKGNISQASAVVVLTGIYGATFGASFLTSLGIRDPVARGMGVGGSGQGLGVASMLSESEAYPFAAISMVLTAMFATVLVSVPPVADALVNLAIGK
jgi:putative effector of murein hydrolase